MFKNLDPPSLINAREQASSKSGPRAKCGLGLNVYWPLDWGDLGQRWGRLGDGRFTKGVQSISCPKPNLFPTNF